MTQFVARALLLAALAAGALGAAAIPPPSARPSGCAACREKNPVLDPASLKEADDGARAAYAAARAYPETIDKIHCYCGCEESPNLHHRSLLTCFTTLHATGCEICQGEARMAGKMKQEGSPDEEIKQVVESIYKDRN